MKVETQEMKTEKIHEEKEMMIEIPMRENEEKTGTVMKSEQKASAYTEREMSDRKLQLLESINEKLDIVLATQKANMEV